MPQGKDTSKQPDRATPASEQAAAGDHTDMQAEQPPSGSGPIDYEALLRATPGHLLVLSPALTILTASDAYFPATLTRREDIVGRSVFDVFPDANPENPNPVGPSTLAASLARALETKRPDRMPVVRYDVAVPPEQGGGFEERHWRSLNTPILDADGRVRYILHSTEDVTAEVRLKAAESAREQERALMRRIIDNAPVAISYLNRDLVYEWVNPRHAALFGITVDRFIGKTLKEVYGEEGEVDIRPLLQGVLDTGQPYFAVGFPFHASVGGTPQVTYWDFTYQPVFSQGQVVGVLPLAQEVSERVERERLQQRHIHSLEAADRHKDQFLGILSHELRTPLNAIQGFGSVLADGLAGELTPAQANYVGKVLAGSEALLRLVDDLLDMSRVQAGKFALDWQTVEVASLAKEALAMLAAEAMHKGQSLINRVPADLPALRGDPRRLCQVLNNLIANAIKYTPEGGTITVTAAVEAGRLRVAVVDTGIGVPHEQQSRIFEAFTQVDMSNTRARGGVGLGLSIVKGLIEAHGGEVGVESQGEGAGSTFWFTLPLRAETP
jgi:PAS domain S-box-containing protein